MYIFFAKSKSSLAAHQKSCKPELAPVNAIENLVIETNSLPTSGENIVIEPAPIIVASITSEKKSKKKQKMTA